MSDQNKEQIKAAEEAKKKADAEAKEQAVADAQAKAVEEARVKAEEEAQAKADAEHEVLHGVRKRVFRVIKFLDGMPFKETIHTLMRIGGQVNGTTVPALSKSIKPNHASQYVLLKGAIEYPAQLAVLRDYEEQKILEEVDPETVGVPWIPEIERKIQEAKALVLKLEAQRL